MFHLVYGINNYRLKKDYVNLYAKYHGQNGIGRFSQFDYGWEFYINQNNNQIKSILDLFILIFQKKNQYWNSLELENKL